MNTLQDVREAQAMWERKFAGKQERVNLSIGRPVGLMGLLAGLFQKVAGGRETAAAQRPAYRMP